MELKTKMRTNKYDRVMSRVYNQSNPILKSSSVVVTRHDPPSSVRLSTNSKPSVAASSIYSELPTVMNDYVPDSDREKPKRRLVVKPRKTLKSLDPALSPPRPRPVPRSRSRPPYDSKQSSHIRAEASAPSVLTRDPGKWSESHVRQCYSSRSHSKLKELKDEIQIYQENEKMMKIRSRLYKSCGVVLDDFGFPAVDKAIQVECPDEQKDHEKGNMERIVSAYSSAVSIVLDNAKNKNNDLRRPFKKSDAVVKYVKGTALAKEKGYSPAPLSNGSAGSPLGRAAGSPPVSGASGSGPSPMAALMSVTDTLPPGSPRSAGGSPPQPPPQRSASRSSQHSPNSSGSNGGRRSSGSRHVSSTTSVSSTEAGEGADPAQPPAPLLKCTLCQERLEDTHFVQCPSQGHHKFCFPCSRDSIKRQQGSEVYCPSGEKCPLANSTVPWAFMQGEIATILGEDFKPPKKERET